MNKSLDVYKYLAIIYAFLALSIPIYAASATPASPDTSQSSETSVQIQQLKDRLATKVAELRQLEKRALYGTVKATTISTITVETLTKDVKIELTDDIKVIQILKGKRTVLTTDDISKGDMVVVFGNYDLTLDLLKAKVVFITSPIPEQIHGVVTERDDKEFTYSVQTSDGASVVVDFERTTVTRMWTKESGPEKIGFSKIKINDIVHVVGTKIPKKENRISALRIFDIGPLLGNVVSPAPSPEPTNSSPSGTMKPTAKPTTTP